MSLEELKENVRRFDNATSEVGRIWTELMALEVGEEKQPSQ